MDDFGHEYFQSEMTHAVADLQRAQLALHRARQATVVTDGQADRGWTLAVANVRSALLLVCTLSVSEAAKHSPEEHQTSISGCGGPATAQ